MWVKVYTKAMWPSLIPCLHFINIAAISLTEVSQGGIYVSKEYFYLI